MSLSTLNPRTLAALEALALHPTDPLPAVLHALDPTGPWELLTQRLGSEQVKVQAGRAELVLPLLDKSGSQSGALSSRWTWSASATLDAQLSMDLLADEDLAGLGVRPDDGHTLVAYGASLTFGGRVGAATSAVAWGSAGASAEGTRSAAIRWFVQAADGDLLLQALVSAQRHFASPDDLGAMLRLANRTDWFGVELALTGEAQLALNVSAQAAGSGWTFSIDGEKTRVGLSAGLDASFTARRESDWLMRATAVPLAADGGRLGLRVTLHDVRLREQQAAATFSAGADFSAVTASAERFLRAALPDVDHDLLDKLTRPGTALRGAISSLIDRNLDGPLKDLAMLLTGGGDGAALKQQAVDRLTGGLVDTLDGALGRIAGAKGDVNQALADWLARVLGPSASALTVDDELKAVVAQALDQATQGLTQSIADLKGRLVGKTQQAVDAVLKPLGELGAQFGGALDHLDDNAASKAIDAALARYADLREKFLSKLTDASRQKVMLTLTESWSRERRDEAMVDVLFVPPANGQPLSADAERLYHAILGGRLLALPELVAAAQRAGAIAKAEGWLLSSAKTMKTQRVGLDFFGVQIGSSTSWLRDVGVKVDLVTGHLLAAQGSLDVETAIVNPWKNRQARLGVRLALDTATAAGVPPALSASLDGAFSAIAGDFARRDKVQDLLDTYARSTGGPRTDVERLLDVPAGAAGAKFWKDLTLSIPVTLDATQWQAFAVRDPDEIEAVALAVALDLFRERYRTDSLFSKDPVADLAGFAADFFEAGNQANAGVLAYLRQFPARFVNRFSAPAEARRLAIPANDSGGISDRGTRLFMAFQRLSAVVQAPRRLQALARQAADRVRTAPTPVDPQALRNALDELMQQMQQALSPVALVSETWLGIGIGGAEDEPVSWPFTSFITTMAKLSGMPVPPGFVPVAQVGQGVAVKLVARG